LGHATITHNLIGPDNSVYISGRCSPEFRQWLAASKKIDVARVLTPPEDTRRPGGSDLYLARLSPNELQPDWIMIFEDAERPSAAWEGRIGRKPGVHAEMISPNELVFVAYDRLYSANANGDGLRELGPTKGGCLLAADMKRGLCYIGGDENTNTGREPWRRPFLRQFDREGKQQWEIWRWDSKRVGLDKYRLVSDSSVRQLALRDNGDLVVGGWSDGGNSIFHRQPTDLDAPADFKPGFINSLWGAGVGSFSRIMNISGDNRSFRSGTVWCSFLTTRNKPNSCWIDDLAVLDDDRIAVVGRSASAFIESPDAWVRKYPEGGGGTYFAVFSSNVSDLLFGSTLPTLHGRPGIAVKGTKVVVATGAVEPATDEKPLLPAGYQSKPGGEIDGYLLLVDTAAR
jgi:hypothetical protein